MRLVARHMVRLHPLLLPREASLADLLVLVEGWLHWKAATGQPVAGLETIRGNPWQSLLRKFVQIIVMICLVSV